jgi:hypothetical protein
MARRRRSTRTAGSASSLRRKLSTSRRCSATLASAQGGPLTGSAIRRTTCGPCVRPEALCSYAKRSPDRTRKRTVQVHEGSVHLKYSSNAACSAVVGLLYALEDLR